MKVLIIEDDINKLHAILNYANQMGIKEVATKTSFHSGLKELESHSYDLALLDMSMPAYDITGHENGGRPLPLAGRDILYKLWRKKNKCKAIVITQYEDFGGTSLKSLDEELKKSFPEIYLGAVYYTTMQEGWKNELRSLLSNMMR